MPAIAIDLLIEARWMIPVEPANVTLEDHALAIDKGRIVAILPQTEARTRYAPRTSKKLPHHILIPGLVNAHTHAAMTLLRGLADDLPLKSWLRDHIWPAESRHVSAQFVHDGTLLACAEMLKGGTTCFNDMYFHPQAAAKAALAAGMRASIGLIAADFSTPYATDIDDYLAKGMAARDELMHEPLLSFCLAPHAPYSVDDEGLTKVLTLAEQCEIPIHIHIHETQGEIDESIARHGARPLERLRHLGLLGPGLFGAHATHLLEAETHLLAQHGCSVVHCPTSNLKLACGIAPITQLNECGVNVALGTDGAASNNRLDLMQEMRLAALLAKVQSGRADAIDAHQVLRMATLHGAHALGLGNRIGSIAPGKQGDVCAINVNDVGLTPCYDPVALLTYAAGRENVTDVWVAGECRISDGKLLAANEIELINLAALWQNQIRPRSV